MSTPAGITSSKAPTRGQASQQLQLAVVRGRHDRRQRQEVHERCQRGCHQLAGCGGRCLGGCPAAGRPARPSRQLSTTFRLLVSAEKRTAQAALQEASSERLGCRHSREPWPQPALRLRALQPEGSRESHCTAISAACSDAQGPAAQAPAMTPPSPVTRLNMSGPRVLGAGARTWQQG